MLMDRSAAGPTTVVAVATLLAGTGSNWFPCAVAVAVIAPSCVGTTVIVAVAPAPKGSVPTVQRLPSGEIEPWLIVAERNATLAGKTLPTVTPELSLGPRFVTEMV